MASLFNVENEPTNAPSFYILTIDQLMGVKHNEILSGFHQFIYVLASHISVETYCIMHHAVQSIHSAICNAILQQ